MKIILCPNCGREVDVLYDNGYYECPHCKQRWGIR